MTEILPSTSVHHVVMSDRCVSEAEVLDRYIELLRLFSVEEKSNFSGRPVNQDK